MAKTIKVSGKKHVIKKNKKGDVIVDHAGKNDPKWDKINLTDKAGAKTIKAGVKATKDWHKSNPHKSGTNNYGDKNGNSKENPAWATNRNNPKSSSYKNKGK
jgi:hypothetical protein